MFWLDRNKSTTSEKLICFKQIAREKDSLVWKNFCMINHLYCFLVQYLNSTFYSIPPNMRDAGISSKNFTSWAVKNEIFEIYNTLSN